MLVVPVCLSLLVNPARAGMIRVLRLCAMRRCGKPRASGDDPACTSVVTAATT